MKKGWSGEIPKLETNCKPQNLKKSPQDKEESVHVTSGCESTAPTLPH